MKLDDLKVALMMAVIFACAVACGAEPTPEDEPLGETTQAWCVGCQVGAPAAFANGYGLRPITEAVNGQTAEFPRCVGSRATGLTYECRMPVSKYVWLKPAPSGWAPVERADYNAVVDDFADMLRLMGWTVQEGTTPPNVAYYLKVQAVNIGETLTPIVDIQLEDQLDGGMYRLKVYQTCNIHMNWFGVHGFYNNGGHGELGNPTPAVLQYMRKAVFVRSFARCVGLGGHDRFITEWPMSDNSHDCAPLDPFMASSAFQYPCYGNGGGNGATRREWLPAGWWSQRYLEHSQQTSIGTDTGLLASFQY